MTKPTRLLMLAERFPPDLGGLARSGARIAGALARTGVEVDVLAWTRAAPPGALESIDASELAPGVEGVTLHRLGLYANQDFSLQHTINVMEWLHAEQSFDAVWGHYLFPAGFTAVLFAASHGLPSVVSARGNDVDRTTFPPGDFARLTWTLERATVLSAVSQDLARKMGVLLGGEREVLVTPNAVDATTFAPGSPPEGLREELGIAPEEAVLLFCGELREKKGFPFLLDALLEVQAERPACLLVVGEARPREASRLAAFRADNPQARIVVTGRLDDPARVVEHLRLGDVFLHPSVWDGLPNAVLEAMACGVPVLASRAGGIPEVVEHGVSGFLLAKHQLHRLGEAALDVLCLPPEDRQRLTESARARVVESFSPAVEEQRLRDVVQRLTGSTPSSA